MVKEVLIQNRFWKDPTRREGINKRFIQKTCFNKILLGKINKPRTGGWQEVNKKISGTVYELKPNLDSYINI